MKPGGPLKRDPAKDRAWKARSKPLSRTGKRLSGAEQAAHDAFRAAVLQIDPHTDEVLAQCLWSVTRPDHVCDGPLDPHHLIEAQYLRQTFAHFPTDKLLAVVYDPRIGVPLCRNNAHAPVTNHTDYVYLEELTLAATEFAADLDIVSRLQRECPPRPHTPEREAFPVERTGYR